MKINVEQRHIDNGVPHDGCNCPVALALKDYYNMYDGITVGHAAYSIYKDQMYWFPREVTRFILDFDGGLTVNPISFEIDPDTDQKMPEIV